MSLLKERKGANTITVDVEETDGFYASLRANGLSHADAERLVAAAVLREARQWRKEGR